MRGWFVKFWGEYAGERALKTVAQTMLAMLTAAGAQTATGVQLGILSIDWITVLSVSLLAGIMSLLTSIVSQTSKKE
jgi:hypothetical protein